MLAPEIRSILELLLQKYQELKVCENEISEAYAMMNECFANGGKLLTCGNGGSSADSDHIVGELMKSFRIPRPVGQELRSKLEVSCDNGKYLADMLQQALPAISLTSNSVLISALLNDVAADMVYAQQVFGVGKPGDVLLGISTSGNAPNVVNALKVARVCGILTIGLTGSPGGQVAKQCDIAILVPQKDTYLVQELHLPVYHALCAMLEQGFYGEKVI